MRKKHVFHVLAICALVGLGLSVPADAASSLTIEVGCDGVRFTGATDGDTVVLHVGLHAGSDSTSTVLQNTSHTVTGTPFDVFIAWNDPDGDVDGQLYRVAISVNGKVVTYIEEVIDCPPETGDEGCTPGYWKNHLEDWAATGYSTSDSFEDIFGVDLGFSTLGEAVEAKGGGDKKLARHGTAALLNAAHPDVNYPLTVAEVIAAVQSGDDDTLAEYNELGCDDL